MNEALIYNYVINRDDEENTLTSISIPGFDVKRCEGKIITADNLRSYNDFNNPNIIAIKDYKIEANGENFEVNITKHSICMLKFYR